MLPNKAYNRAGLLPFQMASTQVLRHCLPELHAFVPHNHSNVLCHILGNSQPSYWVSHLFMTTLGSLLYVMEKQDRACHHLLPQLRAQKKDNICQEP